MLKEIVNLKNKIGVIKKQTEETKEKVKVIASSKAKHTNLTKNNRSKLRKRKIELLTIKKN